MGRELQRLMVNQPNQSHTLTRPPPPPPPLPFNHPSSHPPLPLLCCSGVPVARPSVPAVVLDHVGQLDDELALFILLTALKGMFLEGVAEGRRDLNDRRTENNDLSIYLTESRIASNRHKVHLKSPCS